MSPMRLISVTVLVVVGLSLGLGLTLARSGAEAEGGEPISVGGIALGFPELNSAEWFVAVGPLPGSNATGSGDVTLRFGGEDVGDVSLRFFDVFVELAFDVQGPREAVTATEIYEGDPEDGGRLVVALPCDPIAPREAEGESCEGPNAIFSDGFESGDLSRAALAAGRVFVLVRTTAGDLGGFLQPVADEVVSGDAPVEVQIPAGLSPLGFCGAEMTTDQLFDQYPQLRRVFVLVPLERRFDVADPGLPRSIRQNFTLRFGTAVFVSASESFTMEIPVGGDGSAGFLPTPVVDDSLSFDFLSGLNFVANCGDTVTNTDLLDRFAENVRIFTFLNQARRWVGISTDLPPLLREETLIPNASAFMIITEVPGTIVLPCLTTDCTRWKVELGGETTSDGV